MRIGLGRWLALAALPLVATAAHADPIYLKAGQCIIVGAQQVCAMQNDLNADAKNQILYVCRYGQHPGAELTDLKSYALYQMQVSVVQGGGKTETLVKNYGPNDKEVCEKEAEKRQAAVK